MAVGFVSKNKNNDFLSRFLGNCSCDGPQTGGLAGTLKNNNRPKIITKEERPSTINPKTGERVYIDQLKIPGALYLIA